MANAGRRPTDYVDLGKGWTNSWRDMFMQDWKSSVIFAVALIMGIISPWIIVDLLKW